MTTRVRTAFVALAAIVCAMALSSAGFAAMIVQHQGNTNPATEGWTWASGSNCGVSTGPVTNDGGYDAWYTDDTTASDSQSWGSWTYNCSAAEDAAVRAGWKAAARLRVIDPEQWMYGAVLFQVNSGTRRWHLGFTENAGGNTVVNAGTEIDVGPTCTLDSGYHLYEIVCDMSTEKASVYIDGNLWISDWSGYGWTDGGSFSCAWGSGSSPDKGRGNWNMASLEAVPEPGAFAGLATALVSFAGFRVRRRK